MLERAAEDDGPFLVVQEDFGRLGCGDDHGERSDGAEGGTRTPAGLPTLISFLPTKRGPLFSNDAEISIPITLSFAEGDGSG